MGGIRRETWRRLMNSALQTIILSALSIQIKHVRRTISLTHTCTANTQRTLWFLCNTEGSEGEIPLNTKPRKNTGNKLKRNIPREPTHWWTLKLTLWIGTDIMSCSLSSSTSPGRERACLRIHTHTHAGRHAHRRSWVHMHLAQTFLLWREWPVLPCLVCSSALSKCDKTHEWARRNSGDLQHRDRFTALLLQTYIHWNIYSPPVIVIYCGLGKEQICTSIFFL